MAERVAFTSLACLMYGYINTPTDRPTGETPARSDGRLPLWDGVDICRVNLEMAKRAGAYTHTRPVCRTSEWELGENGKINTPGRTDGRRRRMDNVVNVRVASVDCWIAGWSLDPLGALPKRETKSNPDLGAQSGPV